MTPESEEVWREGEEEGPESLLRPVPAGYRSGYVAIAGRPNVGKSTLMNALVGEKIAIVSPKPQTTRTRLLGILTRPEAQIVFVDTPGIHQPQLRLGEEMVATAERAVAEADVVLCVVDVSQPPNAEDEQVVRSALKAAIPRFLVANKVDLLPRPSDREAAVARYLALGPFDRVQVVSAVTGEGLAELVEALVQTLPEGPQFYPEDQISDQLERDIGAELIREAVLRNLHQEVPHSVAVQVEEWQTRPNGVTYIRATIFVEKESQKGILLGAGGRMMKRIGRQAREELEFFVGGKVYLDLWVKVLKNWRKDENALRRLGLAGR
jgi:GTP-binding protein Era